VRYKRRVPEDCTHDQVTVEVAIESTRLTPEQITDAVGVPWDEARHIGDLRGRTGKTWDRHVWRILNRKKGVDYPGRSAHELLPVCMTEFLDRLKDISGGLQSVIRSEGGEFGVHITSAFIPGLSFEPQTLRVIAELGLSVDVDVILYSNGTDED
jgi:hypothetical protein